MSILTSGWKQGPTAPWSSSGPPLLHTAPKETKTSNGWREADSSAPAAAVCLVLRGNQEEGMGSLLMWVESVLVWVAFVIMWLGPVNWPVKCLRVFIYFSCFSSQSDQLLVDESSSPTSAPSASSALWQLPGRAPELQDECCKLQDVINKMVFLHVFLFS